MKVLIWIGCYLVTIIVNAIVGALIGFQPGYLVVYIAVGFVARKLCSLWEDHKLQKEADKWSKAEREEQKNRENGHYAKMAEEQRKSAFCPACGALLMEKSGFCRKCGAKIEQ